LPSTSCVIFIFTGCFSISCNLSLTSFAVTSTSFKGAASTAPLVSSVGVSTSASSSRLSLPSVSVLGVLFCPASASGVANLFNLSVSTIKSLSVSNWDISASILVNSEAIIALVASVKLGLSNKAFLTS